MAYIRALRAHRYDLVRRRQQIKPDERRFQNPGLVENE
jgi:hypothetical protein